MCSLVIGKSDILSISKRYCVFLGFWLDLAWFGLVWYGYKTVVYLVDRHALHANQCDGNPFERMKIEKKRAEKNGQTQKEYVKSCVFVDTTTQCSLIFYPQDSTQY